MPAATIIALLGAECTGKTTLARAVFADKPYVSLEDPIELALGDADAVGGHRTQQALRVHILWALFVQPNHVTSSAKE